MCGIVGILGNITFSDYKTYKDFFSQALYVDALRGPDSTGIFAVKAGTKVLEPEVDTIKKAMHALDFLTLPAVNKVLTNLEKYSAIIGHNRWATMGKVTNVTAHPFQYGHITMVHNGTLHSHSNLEDGSKFSVDSEAICYSIYKVGIEETVKKLDGAFTLVWHDAKDDTLNIIRNDKRPFHFAKVKNKDAVLMASESEMLNFLADRAKVDIEKIVYPAPGDMITFSLQADQISSYKITKLEYSTDIPKSYGGYNGYGGYDEYGGYNSGGKSKSKNVGSSATYPENKTGVKPGDKVEFTLGTCQPYSTNSTHGKYIHQSIIDDDLVFEVHSVPLSVKSAWDNKHIEAEVTNVYYSQYNKKWHASIDYNKISVVNKKLKLESKQIVKIDDLKTKVPGPHGSVTIARFNQLTSDGCSFCGCDIIPEEAENTYWDENAPPSPICDSCACNNSWTDFLPNMKKGVN